MSAKYCDDPDSCNYSDCPTAFCDKKLNTTMNEPTPTPRTNAHLSAQVHTYSPSVAADFARQLETELAAMREVAGELADELKELHYGEMNRYPTLGMYPALDKFTTLTK